MQTDTLTRARELTEREKESAPNPEGPVQTAANMGEKVETPDHVEIFGIRIPTQTPTAWNC